MRVCVYRAVALRERMFYTWSELIDISRSSAVYIADGLRICNVKTANIVFVYIIPKCQRTIIVTYLDLKITDDTQRFLLTGRVVFFQRANNKMTVRIKVARQAADGDKYTFCKEHLRLLIACDAQRIWENVVCAVIANIIKLVANRSL